MKSHATMKPTPTRAIDSDFEPIALIKAQEYMLRRQQEIQAAQNALNAVKDQLSHWTAMNEAYGPSKEKNTL